MNKKYIIIAGLIALVAVCLVYKSNTRKQVVTATNQEQIKRAVNKSKAVSAAAVAVQKNNAVRGITSETEKNAVDQPTAVATDNGSNIADLPVLKKTLETFHNLSQVVIKSDAQKKMFQQMFTQENIDDAKKFLLNPESVVNQTTELQHMIATNYLIEAIKSNPTSAVPAIFDVIVDAQIESKKLPSSVRQLMAEDKAGLMYNGLAISKDLETRLSAASLPKATQLIRENVIKEYKLNVSSSQAEVAEYKQRPKGQ